MIVKNINDLPSTEKKSLNSLISSMKSEYELIIPNSYQREYAWTEKEISTLINDINETIEDPEQNCYLGRIVLSNVSTKRRNIVDGQQRLTTLFMILHNLSHKTGNVYRINQLYFGPSDNKNEGFILKCSSESRNQNIVNLDTDSNNPISNAYKIINEFLYENEDNPVEDYESYLTKMLNQIWIEVQVIPPEYEEEFFLDINHKGVKLDTIDILKSTFRRNVTDFKKFDEIWDKIILNINKLPNNIFSKSQNKTKLDTLIAWYLRMTNKQNADLFKIASGDTIMLFIKDILSLCEFTVSILTDSGKLYNKTKLIKYFSDYSFIPYMWKMCDSVDEDTAIQALTVQAIVAKGEKLRHAFRTTTFSNNYMTYNDFFDNICQIDYTKHANVRKVLTLAESILRSQKNNTNLFTEFDNLYSRWNTKNNPPRYRLSIEHIQSQSSGSDFVHSLGNLTLLTVSENTEVQDNSKFNHYINTEFLLTNILCDGKKHDLEANLTSITKFNSFTATSLKEFDEVNSLTRLHEISKLIFNYFN